MRSVTLPDYPDDGSVLLSVVHDRRLRFGTHYGTDGFDVDGRYWRRFFGRASEVGSDGTFGVRWPLPEGVLVAWTGATALMEEESWSLVQEAPWRYPAPGPVDVTLNWAEVPSRRVLLRVPLRERWGWGFNGACSVDINLRFLHLSGDGDWLWFFRYTLCEGDPERDLGIRHRVHVWHRPGPAERFASETTPSGGVPFAGQLAVNYFEGTTWGLPDGEMWTLAFVAGAPPDDQIALRAVRFATDGTVAAVSPAIFDPALLDYLDPSTPTARGAWARPTSDGAFVGHVAARTTVSELSRESMFFRVERDGAIAWRVSARPGYLATSGTRGTDTNVVLHRDGVAALLDEPGSQNYFLFAVEADGTLRWPTGGPWLESDSSVVRAGFGADDEHFFVLGDGDSAVVERYDADTGEPDWPSGAWPVPGEIGASGTGGRTFYWLVLPDGAGGAFAVLAELGRGSVQHIDSLGRPLFGWYRDHCESGLSVGRPIEFERP